MMWLKFILFGILGGLIGGMGMGGGTLLIPLLTLCAGVEQLEAQTINLISFIPMAIFSLAIHIKNALVDYKALWKVLPYAVFASTLSSFFALKIKVELLRVFFGVFLLIIGIVFIFNFTKSLLIGLLSPHKTSNMARKITIFCKKLKKS